MGRGLEEAAARRGGGVHGGWVDLKPAPGPTRLRESGTLNEGRERELLTKMQQFGNIISIHKGVFCIIKI